MDTHTLTTDDAELVYDIRGPLPPADVQLPLLAIGSPMDAAGFATLASHFSDRTVVTYDPAGIGRSKRTDGSTEITPQRAADDLHQIITALGVGPVDVFGSSGGAIVGLALVTQHPGDVHTLVAHEPPLLSLVPDSERAFEVEAAGQRAYHAGGIGPGMATFIQMVSWQGEYNDEFEAQTAPDPAMFGLPTEDDGVRDDPLMSGRSNGITRYQIDPDALRSASSRVVIGVGEDTGAALPARSGRAAAVALGQEPTMFPGDHGGFMGGEYGQPSGKPVQFAARLREVLDQQ